jgi:F-type H+-transporting ATPase subunit gamma
MPNLKEVKNRISSVTSTQQITKAMKMVAAAKLRRAQDRIIQMRPYAQRLGTVLKKVSSSSDESTSASSFTAENGSKGVLLIVVTSDRGLCGAFNSNVFKSALLHIKANHAEAESSGNLTILPIGKRGYDFFKKRKYNMVSDYYTIMNSIEFSAVKKAAEFVMDAYTNGDYGKVELIYNEFKNVATQKLNIEPFLPIMADHEESANVEIDYIFEPNKEEIIAELIPKSLKIQLYRSVLESNASEQGARMTAMNQATDNAGELLKQLKLTYNRTRQAAITKEILEIVGGANALKS